MGKSKNKHDGSDNPRYAIEFGRLWVSLQNEFGKTTSDRTAVVVGASLVDSALEMLLRHFFISRGASQKECDTIFTDGDNPPVQSFGLRIRFAKALGLIEPWMAGILRCLKGYRNRFAHEAIVEPLTNADAKQLLSIFQNNTGDVSNNFKRNFLTKSVVGLALDGLSLSSVLR